jgi:hypothetical protein
MQDQMLNTENLSILAESVNDIVLEKDETDPDEKRMKIGGVVLGIYLIIL